MVLRGAPRMGMLFSCCSLLRAVAPSSWLLGPRQHTHLYPRKPLFLLERLLSPHNTFCLASWTWGSSYMTDWGEEVCAAKEKQWWATRLRILTRLKEVACSPLEAETLSSLKQDFFWPCSQLASYHLSPATHSALSLSRRRAAGGRGLPPFSYWPEQWS